MRKLQMRVLGLGGLAMVALASMSLHAATNRPPTITGSATTTATVGSAYSFMPAASDPDGDRLRFRIANRPAWASFSSKTGRLTGTPGAAGTSSGIVISVTDGKMTASLPAFSITAGALATAAVAPANTAPAISGTPAATVQAGSTYSFTPVASDTDGDALGFSVSNKPAWATFSIVNGQLSGTPSSAQTGDFAGIVISVSDGKTTASLPGFAISVTSAPSSVPSTTGTATLQWYAPRRTRMVRL